MLPYKNLIIRNKDIKEPVNKPVALQFIELIQEGKILPGTNLPSTRALVETLQLHRKTIVAIYEILVAENWVDNLPRIGYRVSLSLPIIKPRSYHKKDSPT